MPDPKTDREQKPGGSMHVGNDELRTALQEALEPFAQRIEGLEGSVRELRTDVSDVRANVADMAKLQYEQAMGLAACAKAAGDAANAALEAKQIANALPDATTKLIDGAFAIHKRAISSAVDETVQTSVTAASEPLKKKIDDLEANDGKQNRVDAAICDELGLDYASVAAPDQGPVRTTGPAKPKTTLAKIARENKAGTAAATLTFATLVIELALRILGHH